MFNLTVDEAHTFYVGQNGWLVHNQNGPTMYRTEGNANQKLIIDNAGNVSIRPGVKTIHIGFDADHAIYFLEKRIGQGLEGSKIIGVQVTPEFLEQLRRDAVPQSQARNLPGMPRVVDATKGKDLYEIPDAYLKNLQRGIVPGTGFTVCP